MMSAPRAEFEEGGPQKIILARRKINNPALPRFSRYQRPAKKKVQSRIIEVINFIC